MKKRNGFTLIELLAVIVILAIIALIATPIILGVIEDTKKDVFYTSVLSLINATKMDIGNKYYEDEFTYTLENGVIDNIEFPVSNAEGMYGMIEYDEDSKIQYAVHNRKYCVKKMNYMDKAKIFTYEGICDFSTSEDCFEFSNGTITDYYEYENNNENKDICPRKVVIPETIDGKTVTSIGDNAFKEKELTSVEFPITITYIGNSAFQDNKLSGELDLSHLAGLTSIGGSAFGGSSDGSTNQITSIKLPSSVTSIGSDAFSNNKLSGELDLSHLTGLTSIGPGAFKGSSDGITNQITLLKLPSSVTMIGPSAFSHNKLSGELDLSHLTGLKTMMYYAFEGKSDGSTNQITSIKLPSSVTSIEGSVFAYNKLSGELDLSHLTGLTSIGNGAFAGSSDGSTNQIISIKLPSSVTSIRWGVFKCNKLSGELDLSHLTRLTSIGGSAFEGSSDGSTNQLTSIKLPSSVTSIEGSVFAYNKLSGELDLSNTNITNIGDAAFRGSNTTNQITLIKLPSSVTGLGSNVFASNKLSGELDLSHLTGLTRIGAGAFMGSTNQITSIKLPSSVTSIGNFAFYYNALTSVTFYGRSDLTGVTVGSSAWGWATGYSDANIYFINE